MFNIYWLPSSWRNYKCGQKTCYGSKIKEEESFQELLNTSPIVLAGEVDQLKSLLVRAEKGDRFLLQGGDCAELFKNCNFNYTERQITMIIELGKQLQRNLNKSTILIGRIAGQYAKPRSSPTETRGKLTLPSYFGDMVNGIEFSKEHRIPKPELILEAYRCSKLTMSFIKKVLSNLNDTYLWGGEPKLQSKSKQKEALEVFTSHEALLLDYEESLTRNVNSRWYDLSTHFPWLGVRTSEANGAHVEYLRGITNPVGIKIGPKITENHIIDLAKILNPNNEHGKIVFIYRFGVEYIDAKLPLVIECLKRKNINALLMCDPMHGNTRVMSDDNKVRFVEDIVLELTKAFEIHAEYEKKLGGIHLEMTGEKVLECIENKYINNDFIYDKPTVDPRLNCVQALNVIKQVFLNIEKTQGVRKENSCEFYKVD